MNPETKTDQAETWGIVDLFGHQRLAGKISEYPFGGESFVRVDIPAVDGIAARTRLFGKGATYSMSFTSREIAEGVARQRRTQPVTMYDFDEATKQRMRALPAPSRRSEVDDDMYTGTNDPDDDEFDEGDML